MTGESPKDFCTWLWMPGTCSPWGPCGGPEGGNPAWKLQESTEVCPPGVVVSRLCQPASPPGSSWEHWYGFHLSAPGSDPRKPGFLTEPWTAWISAALEEGWAPLLPIWHLGLLQIPRETLYKLFWVEKNLQNDTGIRAAFSKWNSQPLTPRPPSGGPSTLESLSKGQWTLFWC